MKTLKKLMILSVSALALASCSGNNGSESSSSSSSGSSSGPQPGPSTPYEREDEDEVYDRILGTFDELYADALAETDRNERYGKYAKAEAELLATGLFVPTTTQGGTYAMTRIAPRTVPYSQWGFDSDRLEYMVVVEKDEDHTFILKDDRDALLEEWAAAYADPDHHSYNPKTYLEDEGYTLATEYKTVFSAQPLTLDPGASYYASDAEFFVNCYEGLIKYDNLGRITPSIASSWSVSGDGKTYTFNLRNDVKYVDSQGHDTGDVVKAIDFVYGMEHAIDGDAYIETGLAGLVANVKGTADYYANSRDAAWFLTNAGIKVGANDYQLIIELNEPEDYFLSRLTYNPFLPLNYDKFVDEGGALGVEAFADAYEEDTYNYGSVNDLDSIYYTSAFIPTKLGKALPGGKMELSKNSLYYNASNVTLDKITWEFNDGSNPVLLYDATVEGNYTATGLSESATTLARAKNNKEGGVSLFDKYAYISDTNATTYFNAVNVNRGCFSYTDLVSDQTDAQKWANHYAMNNIHFRRAMQYGFDRATFNAIDVGSEVAELSLRNIYTSPKLIEFPTGATIDGVDYPAGSNYGDLVQHYLLADHDLDINCQDGVDSWYDPVKARAELALAKADLGANWAPVEIDIAYRSNHVRVSAQYNAFKQNMENVFGTDVTVKGLGTTTAMNYYMCTYYASTGVEVNYDAFYGSGWGPDFQDPSSYLGTFSVTGDASMLKVIGL